jgi:hypothetical protein
VNPDGCPQQDSFLVAVFATSLVAQNLSLTPIGFVRGADGERPSCVEFAKKFDDGALLAVVSYLVASRCTFSRF